LNVSAAGSLFNATTEAVIGLNKTIWSLTSPRVKCISGFKNFRSLSQKDFYKNIRQKRPLALLALLCWRELVAHAQIGSRRPRFSLHLRAWQGVRELSMRTG
jgi:hypothetical protein